MSRSDNCLFVHDPYSFSGLSLGYIAAAGNEQPVDAVPRISPTVPALRGTQHQPYAPVSLFGPPAPSYERETARHLASMQASPTSVGPYGQPVQAMPRLFPAGPPQYTQNYSVPSPSSSSSSSLPLPEPPMPSPAQYPQPHTFQHNPTAAWAPPFGSAPAIDVGYCRDRSPCDNGSPSPSSTESTQLQFPKRYPISQKGACSHREHWVRLRGKRGYTYFLCTFCHLGWRKPREQHSQPKPSASPTPGQAMEICQCGLARTSLGTSVSSKSSSSSSSLDSAHHAPKGKARQT